MALAVIVIFGRYFNLEGWSGKLAAGMLAAAALLLALAAIETIRQKIKTRRGRVDQRAEPPAH
jgi:peptidoglycan/LPS O-acetylase OafA/YrhL